MPPGIAASVAAAAGGMGLGAAGFSPGMMDSPEMQQLAVRMMSNPQALQTMFQVRMTCYRPVEILLFFSLAALLLIPSRY